MFSNFTLCKISEDPRAFNDIVWYYENELFYKFEDTSDVSRLIESVYYNADIIYIDQVKNRKDVVKVYNEHLGTSYKTIDDIIDHERIDMINGDRIFAIIW